MTILMLEDFPERFALVEFEPERSRGLRKFNTDNYTVFYFIDYNAVKATNVLCSSRDIEERLKKL